MRTDQQARGGSYADIHAIAQLDRPGNSRGQGRAEARASRPGSRKKVGVEIKQVYLTSGDSDLVLFVDTQSGDNIAKFALALGAVGNVRTRTARAWSEAEFVKLVSELP